MSERIVVGSRFTLRLLVALGPPGPVLLVHFTELRVIGPTPLYEQLWLFWSGRRRSNLKKKNHYHLSLCKIKTSVCLHCKENPVVLHLSLRQLTLGSWAES